MVVVEKLRAAFVLADLDVTIVGGGGDDAVVADLVSVVGGRAPGDLDRSSGERVFGLVAGVVEAWQAVGVVDPLAKVARSVALALARGPLLEMDVVVLKAGWKTGGKLGLQRGVAEWEQPFGGDSTGD